MFGAIMGSMPAMFCHIIPKAAGSDTLFIPAQRNPAPKPNLTASKPTFMRFFDGGVWKMVHFVMSID